MKVTVTVNVDYEFVLRAILVEMGQAALYQRRVSEQKIQDEVARQIKKFGTNAPDCEFNWDDGLCDSDRQDALLFLKSYFSADYAEFMAAEGSRDSE